MKDAYASDLETLITRNVKNKEKNWNWAHRTKLSSFVHFVSKAGV